MTPEATVIAFVVLHLAGIAMRLAWLMRPASVVGDGL